METYEGYTAKEITEELVGVLVARWNPFFQSFEFQLPSFILKLPVRNFLPKFLKDFIFEFPNLAILVVLNES